MDFKQNLSVVMAGLVPAIHDLLESKETWMPGTRPGMTIASLVGTERSLLQRDKTC